MYCARLQGTFYGHQQGQDAQGACSFSENYANAMSQSWANGAVVTLALNRDHFDDSRGCGMCIMYRGAQPSSPQKENTNMSFISNACTDPTAFYFSAHGLRVNT